MTVDLLITYRDIGRESRFVPISGSESFKKYWKPIAEQLKLRLVPEFGGGLHIERDEIPDVLNELQVLKNAVSPRADGAVPQPEAAPAILSNIDFVIEALREVQTESTEVDLWFNY